jgi:RNA polymerase sigma factor (sigma-70 family)
VSPLAMPRHSPRPPLTDAQRELAAAYYPLAKRRTEAYAKHYPWLADEIESEIMLSLCYSVQDWREGTGTVSLATYIIEGLRTRVRDLVRRRRHEPLGRHAQENLPDLSPPPWVAVAKRDEHARVSRCLDRLDRRSAIILQDRFMHDQTQIDVGKSWSIKRQRVAQIEVKAIERMRGLMCLA